MSSKLQYLRDELTLIENETDSLLKLQKSRPETHGLQERLNFLKKNEISVLEKIKSEIKKILDNESKSVQSNTEVDFLIDISQEYKKVSEKIEKLKKNFDKKVAFAQAEKTFINNGNIHDRVEIEDSIREADRFLLKQFEDSAKKNSHGS
ncbi:MAG TPA: hypothetical protein PLZ05_00245 [Alphaproteobacteria bacterium]|nr:hypothetical protein [Alphaproteobacteria bacterium]